MWFKLIIISVFGVGCSVTTSFDLRGVVNGNRMAAVPLGISPGFGELDVEGICTKSGVACLNCTQAITCIALPGGWLKVPLESCTSDTTCNALLGGCSKESVPECDVTNQRFHHSCEQVGVFPDAHDCRKFHLCSPPEGLPDGRPADHRAALCPRHYGYDPRTAQCSVPLEHGQCNQRPVPKCLTVGQNGRLSGSPNHYYVCLDKHGYLHPQVFVCPHGWIFREAFCYPENVINSASDDSASSEEIKSTTMRTTSTSTTTKSEGFFSTEKSTTYPADTFLADKFDFSNYESVDETKNQSGDSFLTSLESFGDYNFN
ncbi:uncharacterized protein LOC114244677 [Bombyx mandarina]|uniref:Uncharacterized protein LOC114244677 n=1 Tax=Bombyx mandarina TaxID=7092 RepID=A0A6J2JVZ8_BOMMA|nr:uncharacterized protein LOC114244677 [Bombyx mandarina]